MADPSVEKWKQDGKLYVWKYRDASPNYSGWHMSADSKGCETLLDLLDRMLSAKWPSKKNLIITRPGKTELAAPNVRGGAAKVISPSNLTLAYPKGQVDGKYWSLDFLKPNLSLRLGLAKVGQLLESVRAMSEGQGDFCIGPDEKTQGSLLWFW
jgi:hypothetical protein